jgi:hypothetical protein
MIWKWCGRKLPWLNLIFYPGICLQGLRESRKNLSQSTRCSRRDSNRAPPEFKSERLPLEPTCSLSRSLIFSLSLYIPTHTLSYAHACSVYIGLYTLFHIHTYIYIYTVDPRTSNGLMFEQLETRTKSSRKIPFWNSKKNSKVEQRITWSSRGRLLSDNVMQHFGKI